MDRSIGRLMVVRLSCDESFGFNVPKLYIHLGNINFVWQPTTFLRVQHTPDAIPHCPEAIPLLRLHVRRLWHVPVSLFRPMHKEFRCPAIIGSAKTKTSILYKTFFFYFLPLSSRSSPSPISAQATIVPKTRNPATNSFILLSIEGCLTNDWPLTPDNHLLYPEKNPQHNCATGGWPISCTYHL